MDEILTKFEKIILEHSGKLNALSERLERPSSVEQLQKVKQTLLKTKATLYATNITGLEAPASFASYVEDELQKLRDRYNDYISTVESLISMQDNTKDKVRYEALQGNLTAYLTISPENLQRLIEGDNIKYGTSAKWLGTRADAYRFAHWLSNGASKFKKRFNDNIQLTERPLHANDSKGLQIELAGSIWDVLKRFPK